MSPGRGEGRGTTPDPTPDSNCIPERKPTGADVAAEPWTAARIDALAALTDTVSLDDAIHEIVVGWTEDAA